LLEVQVLGDGLDHDRQTLKVFQLGHDRETLEGRIPVPAGQVLNQVSSGALQRQLVDIAQCGVHSGAQGRQGNASPHGAGTQNAYTWIECEIVGAHALSLTSRRSGRPCHG